MKPERLTQGDAGEAIDVLCAAFADYPVMRYVLADAGTRYDDRMRDLFGFFCNKRLARNWPVLGVRVDGQLAAVALISEPGGAPPPPELEALRAELAASIGDEALARLERYEEESDVDAPQEPHHFLGVLGVRPGNQGRGLARILLDELARMCAAHPESTGVCLNTEDADNVPLYEHMGYRVLGRRTIDSLETWCMFRADG
jgi:GNAT superfamily N-acetyltransferase